MMPSIQHTRHFHERWYRVRHLFPPLRWSQFEDFLKTQGIFYVSLKDGAVFVAVAGCVLLLKRDQGRLVLVTAYPADYTIQDLITPKRLRRVRFDDLGVR